MLLALLPSLTGRSAHASTAGTVILVSRALAMSSQAPLPPKDFYLDLGTRDGVKAGDLLEVSRDVPVLNAQLGLPDRLLKVVLGEVKVVYAGEFDSVARLERMRPSEEGPVLEPASFMVGDQVHLKTGLPFR